MDRGNRRIGVQRRGTFVASCRFRRFFVLIENPAEMCPCLCISRIQIERPTKGRDCLGVARLLLEGKSEIVVKHRRIGPETDRPFEMRDRQRYAAGRQIAEAEIVMAARLVWLQTKGVSGLGDGLVVPPFSSQE